MSSYPVEDFRSLRVAVLAGGDSSERQISIVSGWQVVSALEAAGHEPTWIDPAECDLAQSSPPLRGGSVAERRSTMWGQFDACFIALHGGAGEDGRIQQRLERIGVPYTGSGPTASRLAMSKSASKERFLQAGVPTPEYALVHVSDDRRDPAQRVARLGYPVVVKPDSQGSSIGVGIADGPRQLDECLAASFAFDPYAVVERLVRGASLPCRCSIGGRCRSWRSLPPIRFSVSTQSIRALKLNIASTRDCRLPSRRSYRTRRLKRRTPWAVAVWCASI